MWEEAYGESLIGGELLLVEGPGMCCCQTQEITLIEAWTVVVVALMEKKESAPSLSPLQCSPIHASLVICTTAVLTISPLITLE